MAVETNSQGAGGEPTSAERLQAITEIFPQMPPGRFTVAGRSLVFPVVRVTWTGGNRIVERARAYRDGVKLDDTGSRGDRWSVEVLFENSIQETGLEENGIPLYPDVADALIALFRVHLTGDLQLPHVAARVRALDFERVESAELRDGATMRFTFEEDNEDGVGLRSLQAPSPRASARRIALATEFDAQSAEVWDFNVRTLNTLTSTIETTLNQQHEMMADTELLATQVRDAAVRVEQAFTQAGTPGRYGLGTPRGHHVQRKLVDQKDMAGRSRLSTQSGKSTMITLVTTVVTSLMRIAAQLGQSYEKLLQANPQLPDPLNIAKGTRVRVFSDES